MNVNVSDKIAVNGTYYSRKTPQEVVEILDGYLHNGKRLRVFLGDRKTGLDWGDENDVMGYIGRSGGLIKIPLIVSNARSLGGPALLDDCIIKIVDIASKQTLYQHPKFHAPDYTIGAAPKKVGDYDMVANGYTVGVYANGENAANFKSKERARRFIDFVTGKRFSH